jgi:hypothetical protein
LFKTTGDANKMVSETFNQIAVWRPHHSPQLTSLIRKSPKHVRSYARLSLLPPVLFKHVKLRSQASQASSPFVELLSLIMEDKVVALANAVFALGLMARQASLTVPVDSSILLSGYGDVQNLSPSAHEYKRYDEAAFSYGRMTLDIRRQRPHNATRSSLASHLRGIKSSRTSNFSAHFRCSIIQ